MGLVLAVFVSSHAKAESSWTGFYLGFNAGYAWQGRSTETHFNPNDRVASAVTCGGDWGGTCALPMSNDVRGATGGVQVGYNWQINPAWMLGIETDFNASRINGSGISPTFKLGGEDSKFRDSRTLDWFGTVRGRIGFLPTHKLLVYGTGGFAYGQVNEATALDSTAGTGAFAGAPPFYGYMCIDGTNCFLGQSSRMAVGWTAGAGFEYKFWKNISVKAEYLHIDLGGGDTNVVAQNTFVPSVAPSSFTALHSRTRLDIVRIGLNLKLGG